MTRDEIIKMAREAGVYTAHTELTLMAGLERFAALVEDAQSKRTFDEGFVTVGHMRERIAAEREACARIAEEWQGPTKDREIHIAQAIRARGQA